MSSGSGSTHRYSLRSTSARRKAQEEELGDDADSSKLSPILESSSRQAQASTARRESTMAPRTETPEQAAAREAREAEVARLAEEARKAEEERQRKEQNEGEGSGAKTYSFAANKGKRKLTDVDATIRDATGKTRPVPQDTAIRTDSALLAKWVDATTVNTAGMTDAILNFIKALDDINGVDVYSNETAALGRLEPSEFLRLPSDLPTPLVPNQHVGGSEAIGYFNPMYPIIVYVMNKAVAPAGENAVRFGLIRMEAVKLGWYRDQREVIFEPSPPDFATITNEDTDEIRRLIQAAAEAAWLVPLAAEHVFRTLGHHYITGLSRDYIDKYEAIFKAALLPAVGTFLKPENLYHRALHWISPGRVWEILNDNLNSTKIPEALRIRRSSAPAGTAIITTTAAVLASMQSTGMIEEFAKRAIADMDVIRAADAKIRQDPVKYHKVYHAYGKPPLTAEDKTEIDKAKREAEKFAPVAKAYCDILMKGAPLGKQKVLDKHSAAAPTITMRARRYFQTFVKIKPTSIAAIFDQDLDEDASGSGAGAGGSKKARKE